ncbi:N-acetyltransferase [Agromyces protaetiae]|uniref:N-acetyltransferase n=1 Tax=Agromyces protaetiae TaxID=2509455 RepID=A0A4P6FB10_9MICO|nr:GNAT family N-acetyltransferase [Agromyces protaetiae]QAY72895.1 N-acetyltransferase [Agromyces protaetiae]
MTDVTLVPWSDDDLATLRRGNTPELTAFLGGPESDDQLAARHARYLRMQAEGTARMFRVATFEHPEGIGTIGYWDDAHHPGAVETGWSIESAHQGRGAATAAVLAMLADVRAVRGDAEVRAYPRVANEASNAICRKAGFVLAGQEEFEYPKGHFERSNVWVFRPVR